MARYQPQATICRKESSRSEVNKWFQLATVGDATLQVNNLESISSVAN